MLPQFVQPCWVALFATGRPIQKIWIICKQTFIVVNLAFTKARCLWMPVCKRMMYHILFAKGQPNGPLPWWQEGGPEASISKYLVIEVQQPCRYISAKVSQMPTLGKLQTSTPSYTFTNLHIRLKSNMISLPKILSFWCEILTWEDISKCRSALRSNDLLRRRHSADFPSAKRARLTLIKQLWGQNFHLIQGYT